MVEAVVAPRGADASVTLLGSAAVPWPVPDCTCRVCLAAPAPVGALGLRVRGLTIRGATVQATETDVVTVAPGDAVERDGVRVVGLPAAAGATALVIVGAGTGTVLWAPAPGPLPELTLDALAGARLDVAALSVACADGEHLARNLAQLRRVDALADGCDVVAVGLDHGTSPARSGAMLPRWGARTAPDGAPLGPAHALPTAPPPRRTLVLGPASSGKSAYAETLLAAEPDVEYLPTGPVPGPDDTEWAARVATHRDRRPPWWRTLEGGSVAWALVTAGAPLLLDSVGTWVSAALDRCGAWDDAAGWQQAFDAEVDAVVGGWRRARRRVVAVGEETGWGVVPATPAGRRFRDALGMVNRRLAAESEQVLLVVAGRVTELTEGAPRA